MECTALVEALIENRALILPPYINGIHKSSHSVLEIVVSEEYKLKELESEDIEKIISEKADKINRYCENSGLDDMMLFIVIGGTSSKSNVRITLDNLPKMHCDFTEVIIYNFFKGSYIQGKLY